MFTTQGVGMSHSMQRSARPAPTRGRAGVPGAVVDAWSRIGSALQTAAAQDPQVREGVRTIASWLNDLAGEGAPRDGADRTPIELRLVVERARLKAEACRWVLRRRRLQEEGEAEEEALRAADMDLINRAREMRGCWLWMLQQGGEAPDEIFEQLALVYEALGGVCELCETISSRPDLDEEQVSEIYHLLAEAQSALWAGMQTAGAQRDQDQIDAFVWLRERTRDERIYIERHMRREDPADPAAAPELLQRIAAAADALRAGAETEARESASAT